MAVVLFGVFAFLAAFNAGTMTTLQIQHYGIYPHVGKDNFIEYIRANNRAAFVPAVLPGMSLLLTSIALVFVHPHFMSLAEACAAAALNVIALVPTFRWQRRLQGEMAETGYDEGKVRLLLSTNWIRRSRFSFRALSRR